MKRVAAIIGDTPEFVRWSIKSDCQIRRSAATDTAIDCERFLKPLRSLGDAIHESRVVDGICVQSFDQPESEMRGFFLDEVGDFYGGLDVVQQQCRACNANCCGRLAGCFGMLRRDQLPDIDGLDQIFGGSETADILATSLLNTTPKWYGLWSRSVWESDFIGSVAVVFREWADWESESNSNQQLQWFCRALEACHENGLSLSVQIVPQGKSDGIHWTTDPVCRECNAPVSESRHAIESGYKNRCSVCGYFGPVEPARRRKVMGHRPYLSLIRLIGADQVKRLKSIAKTTAPENETRYGKT